MKKYGFLKAVFNIVLLFSLPGAFVLGQNNPSTTITPLYPYVVMQLFCACVVAIAFWWLFLRDR